MKRRTLALILVGGLVLSSQPAVASQSSQTDAELATGIRQVREGELDAAVITLDGVVRRLSGQKAQARDLARAYTYLAIAYVGLAQQESAKAQFLEAWRADKSLTLSPKEFPPSIIEFFEQARKEGLEQLKAEAQARARAKAQPAPKPSTQAAPPAAASKGAGSKLPLILLGGAALVGGGVAIAASAGGGAGNSTTPPASPLSPAVSGSSYGNLNLTFVSSDPPPGSTVTGFSDSYAFASRLKMTLRIDNATGADAADCAIWAQLASDSHQCLRIVTAPHFSLSRGQSLEVVCNTPDTTTPGAGPTNCPTPVRIKRMWLEAHCGIGIPYSTSLGVFGGGTFYIEYQINP